MSKAFTPPPTLSQDDVRRVADVRRDVWTGGLKGAVLGIFLSSSAFLIFKGRIPLHQRANVFLGTMMGGSAVASFLAALTAGKNSVQKIGDIFFRGAHEWRNQDNDPLQAPSRSTYQQIILENQNHIQDIDSRFHRRKIALKKYHESATNVPSDDDDAKFYTPPPQSKVE
mmetsp:Transcript_18730/g.24321  ORF Transcript_18730/g.24321 Transcript_18730/m.24321 type:complete len:170 (+) Transcript_18730:124-633(+)